MAHTASIALDLSDPFQHALHVSGIFFGILRVMMSWHVFRYELDGVKDESDQMSWINLEDNEYSYDEK